MPDNEKPYLETGFLPALRRLWNRGQFGQMLPLRFFVFGIAVILFLEYFPPLFDLLLPHRDPNVFFEWYTWVALVYFAFAFFSKLEIKKIFLFIISCSIIAYFSVLYLAICLFFIVVLYYLLFAKTSYPLKLGLFILYILVYGIISMAVVFIMKKEAAMALPITVFLNSLGKKSIYLFYEITSEKIREMGLMDFVFYLTFLPFAYPALPVSPSEFIKGFKPHRKHPLNKIFLHGAGSTVWGAVKIILALAIWHKWLPIANFNEMYAVMDSLPVAYVWGIVLLNYLLWFMYLSGLYNVSLGIANMCGFRIKPNFINPLLARDPLDLWKRWNIHYRGWLLRVFYFPLWWKYKITILNVLIVFIISGLSHTFKSIFKLNFRWGYFLYFVIQAIGVIIVMTIKKGAMVSGDVERDGGFRLRTALSIIATYIYSSLVHVVLFADFKRLSLYDTTRIYAKMFGLR